MTIKKANHHKTNRSPSSTSEISRMDLSTFLTKKELILMDGSMGTQLENLGAVMGGQSNISHPECVLEIHKNYAKCGCDILTCIIHKL